LGCGAWWQRSRDSKGCAVFKQGLQSALHIMRHACHAWMCMGNMLGACSACGMYKNLSCALAVCRQKFLSVGTLPVQKGTSVGTLPVHSVSSCHRPRSSCQRMTHNQQDDLCSPNMWLTAATCNSCCTCRSCCTQLRPAASELSITKTRSPSLCMVVLPAGAMLPSAALLSTWGVLGLGIGRRETCRTTSAKAALPGISQFLFPVGSFNCRVTIQKN